MGVIVLPKWTAQAKKRWNQVSEGTRKDILNSHWCPHCGTGRAMQVTEGKMLGRSLLVKGICKICEGEMARVIEPEE